MRTSPARRALCTGLAMAVLIVSPAAPASATSAPDWSGLDVRDYRGPIPAAGDLITTVPLDPALSVSGAGHAFRILYATIDQHRTPAVSTAAVFLPRGAAPPGGWPVIAWAHGTVGLGDDCTPSAHPRGDRDDEYLSHWLDEGYAVVGSDYAGLGTPGLMSYLNSEATAHSVVDSVRAVHAMGLPLSPKWAIVGQSQGGAAAVNSAWWATRLTAGTGLDYRGVIATGTPFLIESRVKAAGPHAEANPVPPATISYAGYILAGLREARPDIAIDSVLSPLGRQITDAATTVCKPALDRQVAGTTVAELFTAPIGSLPGADAAVDDYMATPTSGYDRPIFLGRGLRDRDVPPKAGLLLYEQLLANGQDARLHTYPDQDHSGTVLAAMPDATRFLRQVMNA